MPPKARNQKSTRHVAGADELQPAKTTKGIPKQTKARVNEPKESKSRRSARDDDDSIVEVDEDEDEDAMGSQDVKSTTAIRKLIANQFSKNDGKANAKMNELQNPIAGMFADARLASEDRKRECGQYLEEMVLDIEAGLQARIDPDIEEILQALESRNKCVMELGMQDKPLYGQIKQQMEAAVAETTGSLNEHEQLRIRSRKRLLKYAKRDYRLATERQKLATDAQAYIKHYKRLIVL
ncbi:hypothetical protein FRB91_003537 [Serendipita sp. 411]|nr:hypothetical protein FRB91_003537 [Serendipita sp. 411]